MRVVWLTIKFVIKLVMGFLLCILLLLMLGVDAFLIQSIQLCLDENNKNRLRYMDESYYLVGMRPHKDHRQRQHYTIQEPLYIRADELEEYFRVTKVAALSKMGHDENQSSTLDDVARADRFEAWYRQRNIL